MPRLRVLTACPGTSWVPGQVVDATPEQAEQYLAEGRAELIRGSALEQAATYARAARRANQDLEDVTEELTRGVRPR